MPTQTVSAATMDVGKKGRGKHWTAKEKAARENAAALFQRENAAALQPPVWLNKDALEIWNKKVGEIAGLKGATDLLDALDSEMLAVFCDTVVKYKKISTKGRLTLDDHKILQAYSRILQQSSERLGFTPGSRARLVKRVAEGNKKDEFGDRFD